MSLSGRLARFGPRKNTASSQFLAPGFQGPGCSDCCRSAPQSTPLLCAKPQDGTGTSGSVQTENADRKNSGRASDCKAPEPACSKGIEPGWPAQKVRGLQTTGAAEKALDQLGGSWAVSRGQSEVVSENKMMPSTTAISECPVCGASLTMMDDQAQGYHVNKCLDSVDQASVAAESQHTQAPVAETETKLNVEMRHWLQSLGLQKHQKRMAEEDIDTSCLHILSEQDLLALGISCCKERRIFLQAARLLQPGCEQHSGQLTCQQPQLLAGSSEPCSASAGSLPCPSAVSVLDSNVLVSAEDGASRSAPLKLPTSSARAQEAGNPEDRAAIVRRARKPKVAPGVKRAAGQAVTEGKAKKRHTLPPEKPPGGVCGAKPNSRQSKKTPAFDAHDSSYARDAEAALLKALFTEENRWRIRRKDREGDENDWHGPCTKLVATGTSARIIDRSRSLWSCAAGIVDHSAIPDHVPLATRIAESKGRREAAEAERRAARVQRDEQLLAGSGERAPSFVAPTTGSPPAAPRNCATKGANQMQLAALRSELAATEQLVAGLKQLIADLETEGS